MRRGDETTSVSNGTACGDAAKEGAGVGIDTRAGNGRIRGGMSLEEEDDTELIKVRLFQRLERYLHKKKHVEKCRHVRTRDRDTCTLSWKLHSQ